MNHCPLVVAVAVVDLVAVAVVEAERIKREEFYV